MQLHEWITQAANDLAGAGIGTAKLDAELILSHTLRKGRTWLHAYRDEELSPRYREIADARLLLRLDRVPLAYIIGHKEFYGRRFTVTPATLIPRPESEAIIETLKELLPNTTALPGHSLRLADVGTGSGCLGITAKLELPELEVALLDVSRHALTVATKNAELYHADVTAIRSDLLAAYPFAPDIIVANLPYVDTKWEHSPETNHEPAEALFADDGGIALIKKLIDQATTSMPEGGLLLLEADPVQHTDIARYAGARAFTKLSASGYCIAFRKN